MLICVVTVKLRPAFSHTVPSPFPLGSFSTRPAYPLMLAAKLFLSPLCFHNLTNSFSRSSFLLITIQIAPGVGYPLSLTPLLPTGLRRVQRNGSGLYLQPGQNNGTFASPWRNTLWAQNPADEWMAKPR